MKRANVHSFSPSSKIYPKVNWSTSAAGKHMHTLTCKMKQCTAQTCVATTSVKPPRHWTQVEGETLRASQGGEKWWSQTRTSNNKQSIKSVGGRVLGGSRGVGRQILEGGGGTMRVYLKHGDPVAEGSFGAGMNKTLMAHKTQRPFIQAQLQSVHSCWGWPIMSLTCPNTEHRRQKTPQNTALNKTNELVRLHIKEFQLRRRKTLMYAALPVSVSLLPAHLNRCRDASVAVAAI